MRGVRPRLPLLTAGVDEAGRGPLAGPVTAGAVILDPYRPIRGLEDSKMLTPERRDELEMEIKDKALAWSVAHADVTEIDTLNILQASLLAMKRAVAALAPAPDLVLIDGNRCPALPYPSRAIVRGDQIVPAISAGSILAKVARDRMLTLLDDTYPGYGFRQHKGYSTAQHLAALSMLGVSPIHRRSFEPVRRLLNGPGLFDDIEIL